MKQIGWTAALGLVVAAAPAAAQRDSSPYGKPTAVIIGGPDVGRRAPDFTLPWANRDGVGPAEAPYSLWKDRGKVVVLAFYPRDFTQGCTAQMKAFAEQYDELFGPDVVVVAVSADPLETHARFAESLALPFRLLSDPDQRVSKRYGSADRDGYNRRTIFVIGRDGKVAYRDMQFGSVDPTDYRDLKSAVRAATGG